MIDWFAEDSLRHDLREQHLAIPINKLERQLVPLEFEVCKPFDDLRIEDLLGIRRRELETLARFRAGAANDEMCIRAGRVASLVDELEVVVMARHEDVCAAIDRFLERKQSRNAKQLVIEEMLARCVTWVVSEDDFPRRF